MKFELTYYDVIVHHDSHYAIGTPLFFNGMSKLVKCKSEFFQYSVICIACKCPAFQDGFFPAEQSIKGQIYKKMVLTFQSSIYMYAYQSSKVKLLSDFDNLITDKISFCRAAIFIFKIKCVC